MNKVRHQKTLAAYWYRFMQGVFSVLELIFIPIAAATIMFGVLVYNLGAYILRRSDRASLLIESVSDKSKGGS